MEELRVQSWTELIDRMYQGSWYQPHGRFRSPYVFRGLPDYRYDRRTSLCRRTAGSERHGENAGERRARESRQRFLIHWLLCLLL